MRYSVSRRRPENDRTHVCESCNKEFPHNTRTTNRYCCNACAACGKRQETLARFVAGESFSPKIVRRCVLDLKGRFCCLCGQGEQWNNRPLTLQVDHIDGDSENNAIDNLRVLCPNCHTQTENYGSKGAGNRYRKLRKRNQQVRKSKGYLE